MMGSDPASSDLGWEPAPEPGWVAPHVAAEFPGLAISSIVVDSRPGSTPEAVRRRLRDLSDRFYGAHAVRMRERPIPWAYRAFFRQIGLDPDRTRTPVEDLALERLREGAFKPHGLPDAEQLRGNLCVRDSAPGEVLAGRPGELTPGTLVIADDAAPAGLLFGATSEACAVTQGTRRIAIAAVQVSGVPQIAVDEALWMTAATLEAA
jgi:DNA/RNA-binding domain of Phe-tRNA-synthetase-like protein